MSEYNYLLSRQGDPERLRRIAFEEFVSARNTGRLIAFVGSYANEHLGYPSWGDMRRQFILNTREYAGDASLPDLLHKLYEAHDPQKGFTLPDELDLAEVLAEVDRHAFPEAFEKSRRRYMKNNFSFLGKGNDVEVRPSPIRSLVKDLQITRFLTLNYDLELEWEMFLSPAERDAASRVDRNEAWEQEKKKHFPSSDSHLERNLIGSGLVTSDLLRRDHSDVLIEFALGSPISHRRILHLHGRADDWSDLLITSRDYRDRYWQGGFSKLPFEYGMRLIFAGNPILFVGLGASEPDVMRALGQLLSDNPNRRAVPMFLLWTKSADDAADDVRRLLFYRKFGIHVLYDREIAAAAGKSKVYEGRLADPFDRRAQPLERFPVIPPPPDAAQIYRDKLQQALRLRQSTLMLAQIADHRRVGRNWTRADFRSPQAKYIGSGPGSTGKNRHRIDVWHHKPAQPRQGFEHPDDVANAIAREHPIVAIVGSPGSGRGAIASAIADAFERRHIAEGGRVVVVNGSFATDTDSIFGILSGAANGDTAQHAKTSRAYSIGGFVDLVREIREDPKKRDYLGLMGVGPVTVIINGMERFIAHDGSALSNELDSMIRLVTNAYEPTGKNDDNLTADERLLAANERTAANRQALLRLILIGTPRLGRYLSTLTSDVATFRVKLSAKGDETELFGRDVEPLGVVGCSSYFSTLTRALNIRGLANAPDILDRSAMRRAFFARALDPAALARLGFADPGLALRILNVLAFIGQPVTRQVLYHAPSLWRGVAHAQEDHGCIDAALDQLHKFGLVLDIAPFPGCADNRIGVHKALVTEIRERYGVPLSDSRLASGFNLSLYAAQPVDSYTPEQRWHNEIGRLADYLIGSFYDDIAPDADIKAAIDRTDHSDPEFLRLRDLYQSDRAARLASPQTTEALRAALSLIRSYYSVPALLMYGNRDLDPWMRDGPLSEHADRIARMLRMARDGATIRAAIRRHRGIASRLGPNPFYPDDIVWLNNELGVVRITKGNLYEARAALTEASKVNARFVEFDDLSQNWRRIEFNLVQVDLDRGKIEQAEERLRDIEAEVSALAEKFFSDDMRKRWTKPYGSVRDYVLDWYTEPTHDGRPSRVDSEVPTEIITLLGMIQGYRGIFQHLRGALAASKVSLRCSVAILQRLNEQRAYAFFQRHLASLLIASGEVEQACAALQLCIAAAGPLRQTDIDHSGRVALVQYRLRRSPLTTADLEGKPIPQLHETLRYATSSDMYRLQVETMQALALVHLGNGDVDSALQFTTDAMAISSRCGFGLRKVNLRTLLARVLALRGDTRSARALVLSSSVIASKIHYERAVETAENLLLELNSGNAPN